MNVPQQQGSYRVESFATSVEAEIRRLNAQVDLFWDSESALLQRHGLRDGLDVLDCGCGPGRLIELLKGSMRGLRCVGLEMDPLLVTTAARRLAECGLGECRILQGTAEDPGLAEKSFDFVILRLVLEHVPDPLRALRSLAGLLRPAGRLVVIANDFDFHLRTWPPVPELERLYEAYRASRRSDGGDPCIGRRLPHLLRQAGLAVAGYEIEVAHNAVLGDGPFLKAEGGGIPAQLVRTGFLDAQTIEDMARAWRAMLATSGHSIVRQLFVAVGALAAEDDTGPLPGGERAGGASWSQQSAGSASESSVSGGVEVTLEMVAALVAESLGVKQVEPGHLLGDLGMDSLSAMRLQERLRERTGVEVSIVRLLENISVTRLAEEIGAPGSQLGRTPRSSEASSGMGRPADWEEGEI